MRSTNLHFTYLLISPLTPITHVSKKIQSPSYRCATDASGRQKQHAVRQLRWPRSDFWLDQLPSASPGSFQTEPAASAITSNQYALKSLTNVNNYNVLHQSQQQCDAFIWINRRAPCKNRICSTTMKLRKSLVKPATQQKSCSYNELFGSSARDRHAGRI